MPEVRLGRIFLGWCRNCNLALLGRNCEICGGKAEKIKITPPGDFRIAFPDEIRRIEKTIGDRFGVCVKLTNPVIVNKVPDIDRMHEVVCNGQIIGALRYDIFRGKEIFLPKVGFGQLLFDKGTDKYAVADDGAREPILNGSNLMIPGITRMGDFQMGEEILVMGGSGDVIAVGNARINSDDPHERGEGVRIRVRKNPNEEMTGEIGKRNFEEAFELLLKANRGHMDRKIKRSIDFINHVIENIKKPIACSISGGKDSLATLLLLLDAGIKPVTFFVDTGLEYKETLEEVHKTVKKFNLPHIEKKARGNFWNDLEIFGNSSRDYRWCCKTRKLAPMVNLIEENFPEGVLTFIGQRSYESANRAEHGSVWKNPWIVKQIGASPIQNWNAMEVWLYLFSKDVDFNPLYKMGFERIGCWLCPASDLYDFNLYKHEDYDRYMEFLKRDYTDEALRLGLWRFKRPPKWAPHIEIKKEKKEKIFIDEGGKIRISADMDRVKNLATSMGGIEIGDDGYIWAKDERRGKLKKIVYKAEYCAGCGLCESSCQLGAIYIDETQKVRIDEEKCTHCSACLDVMCPAVSYPQFG